MFPPTVHSKNLSPDPASRWRWARRAMTLVEVMLAVTLFSTMMGATGALLQAGFRAQSTWGGVVESAAHLERGLNRLSQDIASMEKLFAVPVRGGKDQLEFCRVEAIAADGAAAAAEWVRVVYRLEAEGEETALIREAYMWRLGGGNPQSKEILLVVAHAAWSYGYQDAQGKLLWQDAWEGATNGIPKLVRLNVAVAAAVGEKPLVIERVFRDPAGNLPVQKP